MGLADTPLKATLALHPVTKPVVMRTTNGVERLNEEIKRRTRVAPLFPNPESCLRLLIRHELFKKLRR